jgi:hypothetical protein
MSFIFDDFNKSCVTYESSLFVQWFFLSLNSALDSIRLPGVSQFARQMSEVCRGTEIAVLNSYARDCYQFTGLRNRQIYFHFQN